MRSIDSIIKSFFDKVLKKISSHGDKCRNKCGHRCLSEKKFKSILYTSFAVFSFISLLFFSLAMFLAVLYFSAVIFRLFRG